MPKIIHYRNKCIGCNICFEMQPDHWRLSQRDGKATLVNAEKKREVIIKSIRESELSLSQVVASICPTRCIQINF